MVSYHYVTHLVISAGFNRLQVIVPQGLCLENFGFRIVIMLYMHLSKVDLMSRNTFVSPMGINTIALVTVNCTDFKVKL